MMKILLNQWVRIISEPHQGKIFQLRLYNKSLNAIYFSEGDGELISIEEIELISPPFPYWRSPKNGQIYKYSGLHFEQCDTLPIPEQISKSIDRQIRLRAHIKLHKENFKKANKELAKRDVFSDRHYLYLVKDLQDEVLLQEFLLNIVPYVPPAREKLVELAEKFQQLATGGNIANSREEILKVTAHQEKSIFPPTQLPRKKGGRHRGRKNQNPASGWLDIRTNKDGSITAYYCRHIYLWRTKKDKIPTSKIPAVERAIEERYAIAQIEEILGV